MFVQVIEGRTTDAAGLRKQIDRWQDELRPGSVGWLGSTAGVTDDGNFIAVARFESEESARRNSDRAEQGEWWAETEKYLEDVSFSDYTEAEEWQGGGSDDAGFVQVMRGVLTNPARARELNEQMGDPAEMGRPDIIGGVHMEQSDGSFTDVIYFTSESEARKGEAQEMPEEAKAGFEEWMSIMKDVRYIDLREPWLFS